MLSFGRWWGQAQVPVLGVDIAAGGVRVVELRRGRQPRVAHYAHRPLPQGAIRDGGIVMRDAVCDALRDALQDSGSRLRHAALALPAGSVITKTLSLPAALSDDELEMQVESEADASLPFARDEIGIDFATLGPSVNQPDAIDVMLVAARKEKIDERCSLAEAVGLKPLIVDVESHALMSAVALFDVERGAPSPQLIAVLQLDPDRSHCFFMLDGVLLPRGQTGEIVIRGDNVTAGYENNEKANAEGFSAGWFRTGDQGVMDEDGYISITGRLKEIINRGGEKISPREVDEILMDHAAVAQVVCFGMPHPKLGEEVAAVVVLREGQSATEKDLQAFVAGRAADFKVPKKILFMDEIPKGATGEAKLAAPEYKVEVIVTAALN